MRTIHNLIVIITITIISVLLLTGCSIPEDFFILNTTDKEVTTIIRFRESIERYLNDSSFKRLSYTESILDVNNKTKNQLAKKLRYTTLNTTTILINLPPRSTTLIGSSSNEPLPADSITIIKNDVSTSYTARDIYKNSKKAGGLFHPIHVIYRIE